MKWDDPEFPLAYASTYPPPVTVDDQLADLFAAIADALTAADPLAFVQARDPLPVWS